MTGYVAVGIAQGIHYESLSPYGEETIDTLERVIEERSAPGESREAFAERVAGVEVRLAEEGCAHFRWLYVGAAAEEIDTEETAAMRAWSEAQRERRRRQDEERRRRDEERRLRAEAEAAREREAAERRDRAEYERLRAKFQTAGEGV